MTDDLVLAAWDRLLLRSDNWSVDIRANVDNVPVRRMTWLEREADAARAGFAPVRVVERGRTD
jgi:hypothetical protein